jgi:wyosine [tRNA(Phe)-imidazoG37] synthetase (radical SAM superfamily)
VKLSTRDHDRDSTGMTYVYGVVSRRARGVSVGVNLNPNAACNWRCVYCQVPNLRRGAGPAIDLELLRAELFSLLSDITRGNWLQDHAPEGARRLNDVAFSGNGEPTTCPDFGAALEVTADVLRRLELGPPLKTVLITNGSQVHRAEVQAGLTRLASMNGEIWFKLDSATTAGRARLNDASAGDQRVEDNLVTAASLCRTRLQTMALAFDGEAPDDAEQRAWIDLVRRAQARGAAIEDVLLYGLERPSLQPEAPRLSKLPTSWLEAFATRVTSDLGLPVQVHA